MEADPHRNPGIQSSTFPGRPKVVSVVFDRILKSLQVVRAHMLKNGARASHPTLFFCAAMAKYCLVQEVYLGWQSRARTI